MKSGIMFVAMTIVCMIGCKNPGDPKAGPLDEGLFMYYQFSGNANDESTHGFHGEVLGAVLGEDRFGNANSAFSFDGVDDYIELPSDIYLVETFTISLWAKGAAGQSSGSREAGLFSLGSLNPYGLGIDANGRLFFRVVAGRASFVEEAERPFDPSQWYHYAAVFKSGQYLKLFIDGEEVANNTTNIPEAVEDSDGKFWIGARSVVAASPRPVFYFDGLIDDVRIYNRAVSAEQIAQLHGAEQ